MMASKRKGLELVFHLEWREKCENAVEKSVVIGMYDSPATTQSFETFKSYLQKNSGVDAKDVKVTYVTDDSSEWHIESESGFKQALCAFRLKAKLNEVIFLKLDKVFFAMAGKAKLQRKDSNDVQTQYDPEGCNKETPPEWFFGYMKQFKHELLEDITTSVGNLMSAHVQVKREDPVVTVSGNNGVVKLSPLLVCPRKIRSEPSKRARKHLHLAEHVIDKTLKHERKLEIKLDKLEAKTKKIKEKKEALLNKTVAVMEATAEKVEEEKKSIEEGLDAGLAQEGHGIPRMYGGDKYSHTWEIVNCGTVPWPEKTELRLTWGSSCMYPDQTTIKCPPLKPKEKTTLSMDFSIPKQPGHYESYWNFYLDETRFGRWVSFSVIVEELLPYDPNNRTLDERVFGVESAHAGRCNMPNCEPLVHLALVQAEADEKKRIEAAAQAELLSQNLIDSDSDLDFDGYAELKDKGKKFKSPNWYGVEEDDLIVDLSQKKSFEDDDDVNDFLDSDDVEKSKDLFANCRDPPKFRPKEDNNNGEQELKKWDSDASDVSSSYDIVNSPLCDDKEERSGYVYVTVEGNKLQLPKYMLHPNLVAAAEASDSSSSSVTNLIPKPVTNLKPEPVTNLKPEPAEIKVENPGAPEEATLVQLDGAADETRPTTDGSGDAMTDSSRLFIFPETNPGFEVLASKISNESDKLPCKLEVTASDPLQTYTWAQSQTQYTFSEVVDTAGAANLRCDTSAPSASGTNPAKLPPNAFSAVPNYQQSKKFEPQAPPQSPPLRSRQPYVRAPSEAGSASSGAASGGQHQQNLASVHMLPENLVSGAVNVASSAINTAKSVLNMMMPPKPQPGKWVNGHWVDEDPNSQRYKNLLLLEEMGFWDTNLNASLLGRFDDDVQKVVAELLYYK